MANYPEQIILSWQLYDGPSCSLPHGKFLIDADCHSGRKHGCAALRTNNDIFNGEVDDRENIAKALMLSKQAGLDMTYIYGEYPDSWPTTANNYRVWAETADGLTVPSETDSAAR